MKFLQAFGGAMYGTWCIVRYAIVSNVYNMAVVLSLMLPYTMYAVGQYIALDRGSVGVGWEIVIPLIVGVIIRCMKTVGNLANKGERVPVPAQRFTSVDGDGEVTIEQARISELLLYMADLEDWMAKRGML